MKMCCRYMFAALANKNLKLHYVPEIALLGVEEERTIQTPKNKMPVDFCPFCGRRVEITFEEDDEQPGSNEEKEIVIPEWTHLHLSEVEKLGYMLGFFMPMLLEDIAKMGPEAKERTIKNLEEMMRIAQMKPEERPLCTMDQEEEIKRGIEACTVKGEKE